MTNKCTADKKRLLKSRNEKQKKHTVLSRKKKAGRYFTGWKNPACSHYNIFHTTLAFIIKFNVNCNSFLVDWHRVPPADLYVICFSPKF